MKQQPTINEPVIDPPTDGDLATQTALLVNLLVRIAQRVATQPTVVVQSQPQKKNKKTAA